MRTLSYPLRMTCFGMASQRSIRTADVEREYRTRVCRECGRPLNVCGGLYDHKREPARYLFENTIRAFGPTFPGAYTDVIASGDGDLATDDGIWDLKVSKNPPTKEQTLQLLVYYLMCRRSDDRVLKGISSFGMFDPRLNVSYSLRANLIPSEIISTVEKDVVGCK